MTHEEILKALYDETLIGNAPEVKDLVNKGLAEGLGCESMLYDALIPSLEEVGARFERGDYFVPEMTSARTSSTSCSRAPASPCTTSA